MLYCSWDMACDGHNCYFSFWAISCSFTDQKKMTQSNRPKNQFFEKKKNNNWRNHFMHAHQKLWSVHLLLLRYGAWQMDGWTDWQMDKRKKWHIEVDAPPKKYRLVKLTEMEQNLIMFIPYGFIKNLWQIR